MKRIFAGSHSLFINLVLGVGAILFLSMGTLAYFSISYVKQNIMHNAMVEADRFSNTIKLGTHYSMMSNVREDITQIINNIARQENVVHIRIYHKDGHVKFSNRAEEIETIADINDYACTICHKYDPPPAVLNLEERARFFSSPSGQRFLGIVSPIYNEPGCSASCHIHSPDTTILGTLDTVISLEHVDRKIRFLEQIFCSVTILIFLITSGLIFLYLLRFVSRPVKKMITGTQMIAKGEFFNPVTVERHDELGRLASAISHMGEKIASQQTVLREKNEELKKANRELEKLSSTDPLTGLYNRRYLIRLLESEYRRAKRYGHDLSVLLVDADLFKDINDRYGHLCGDMVLKEIARILKETVRSTDIVARYGGEEMVVLLLETDSREAVGIAEKLRQEVESCEITYEDQQVQITVSVGGATYSQTEFEDSMQLLAAADKAMYKAKDAGRNKVGYYTENSNIVILDQELS